MPSCAQAQSRSAPTPSLSLSFAMAASPPPPGDPKSPSPTTGSSAPKEDPGPAPTPPTCRLCGKESQDAVGIFSESGRERGLPEKCQRCLPVLVSGTPCLFTPGDADQRKADALTLRRREPQVGYKLTGYSYSTQWQYPHLFNKTLSTLFHNFESEFGECFALFLAD